MSVDAVVAASVAAAQEVPGDLLLLGAIAVQGRATWSADAADALIEASPAVAYQQHLELVARAWAASPELPGVAVAAALRAAAGSVAAVRAVNQVSLVWTGPQTEAAGFRSTRAVLNTIIADATERLLLVSFASYRVDWLVDRLSDALDRGVEASLVLETTEDSGGDLTFDAAGAFAPLVGRARFYRWPIENRSPEFAPSSRLHAKCVVADARVALITSANLTDAAINDNIELGTLIEAGPLPRRLGDHFDRLIADGTLVEAVPGS